MIYSRMKETVGFTFDLIFKEFYHIVNGPKYVRFQHVTYVYIDIILFLSYILQELSDFETIFKLFCFLHYFLLHWTKTDYFVYCKIVFLLDMNLALTQSIESTATFLHTQNSTNHNAHSHHIPPPYNKFTGQGYNYVGSYIIIILKIGFLHTMLCKICCMYTQPACDMK